MVYQKIETMQELRMRINKFQLYASLTKKLTVKNEKMIFFGYQFEFSWNTNHIISWVLWFWHSKKSHPICFRDYVSRKAECYWTTAESILDVDSFRKILFSAWWICESTNQKTIWGWSLSYHHLISRLDNLLKHAVSPQFLSVGYAVIPLPCFFLKNTTFGNRKPFQNHEK